MDEAINQDIFEILGLTDLPDDRKGQLMSQMTETIQNRIMLRILRRLSEDDQDLLNTIAGQEDTSLMENFISIKVPDLDIITAEEVKLYKKEMWLTAKLVRDKIKAEGGGAA